MMERPTQEIQHKNRCQFETTTEGKRVFREYWIYEWDEKGYKLNEHINNLDQAIKRAKELGYNDDAKKMEQFKNSGN
jgi:hypothetical protein